MGEVYKCYNLYRARTIRAIRGSDVLLGLAGPSVPIPSTNVFGAELSRLLGAGTVFGSVKLLLRIISS